MSWKVLFNKKSQKAIEKLPEAIQEAVALLVSELEIEGPNQPEWKNYGKLKGSSDQYHCHVKSGRPTYVVCWQVIDRKICIMEVYYVGTHEKAPY